MQVRAIAKSVGMSARKIKPVVDAVRGKKVEEALTLLRFITTPAAREVARVVKSAAANAENNMQMSPGDLRIVAISADQGRSLKRIRPRSRGRASPILKRQSHITVVVDEEE